MIFPFFRRSQRRATISGLYGTIVAQARIPSFYRDHAVPDTATGRFELIVLHVAILLDRLAQDSALRDLGQRVFDHFCRDMDSNLREMGIGDLAVPKQMRWMGEAFYGRAQAYRAALATSGDDALQEALARNVYRGAPDPLAVARLAAYMREAVGDLNTQDSAQLAAGVLRFPAPAASAISG
jgi:cytochrome b pre-mRNA-processing protein 3